MICASCSATHDSGSLCPRCLSRLEELLHGLGDDIADLDVQLTRQTRTGPITTARSAERALPYDPAASDVGADVRSFLVGWVQAICRSTGDWPAATTQGLIARLQRENWVIRPDADEFLDELQWSHEQILRVIDVRAPRRFLGPCGVADCDGDVYQRTAARQPACMTCGTTYDLAERGAFLHQAAQDQLVTASVAASALSAWGTGPKVTDDLVRKWAFRGRLIRHGHDQRGHPTYRFGDVVSLANAYRAKKCEVA